MLMDQRHALILKQLHENGAVANSTLTMELNVSSETIRKDLEYLEKKQMLTRVHGGAIPNNTQQVAPKPSNQDYINFDMRTTQNTDTKLKLAYKAAEFVHEGQSIALDAGTSSLMLAKILKDRFNRLTVITNSVKIVLELMNCTNFTVICTGGVLMADEYSFVSDFAFNVLEKCNVDIVFLSASGVTLETGLTDQRIDDIRVQDKMRKSAHRTIAIVDSSKFGKPSLISICKLEDIDVLITDNGLDMHLENSISRATKQLIIV